MTSVQPPIGRSEITIDLGALRANVRALRAQLGDAELWAVVKADAYGHGALDCARAALAEGARVLCVATLGEALPLRAALPGARIVVLGPTAEAELGAARAARVELVASGRVPAGLPVHVKLDTGMGRWGEERLGELPANVVGVMTHLATADDDPGFARLQLARFRQATGDLRGVTLHAANSAAALALPESRLDAARCGIALYGLSPFGVDPAEHGLTPVLSWRSHVAHTRRLEAGGSTGYGRRFVATEPIWIGIVPVGYADGFRRDLSGTTVRVGDASRVVLGAVSMDAFAVELDGPEELGAPVTLVGPGVPLEAHARVAETITYELASRIESGEARALRRVLDEAQVS